MTSTAMTSLPVSAAGALLSGVGRGLLWIVTKFFRTPFTSTGLVVLTAGAAMALGNALYLQPERHPAPLFAVESAPAPRTADAAAPVPVVSNQPAPASADEPETTATATPTASTAAEDSRSVGNEEVAAIQRKLMELNLFDGTVDGYYGPKTADAIRAFETRAGLPPRGALSPQVMDAILRANPETLAQPRPEAIAPAEAIPAEMPAAEAPVATAAVETPAPAAEPAPVEAAEVMQVAAADTGAEVLLGGTPQPADAIETGTATTEPAPAATGNPVLDTNLVAQVQRGLASLGFLHGTIDGVPGDSTARAIRNFEVYHNYQVTGAVTPELVHMLQAAGAAM